MLIPNGRTDEAYNQKYLDTLDKVELFGYDWCVEIVKSFFDNTDVYFDDDSYLMHLLNQRLPKCAVDEYDVYSVDGDVEHCTAETYLDLLKGALLNYLEADRNELITSMIDDMDEEEYEKIKKEVDASET